MMEMAFMQLRADSLVRAESNSATQMTVH